MDVRKLLEEVKTGEMDLERAEALLKDLPYEDLGYASWTTTGPCGPASGKRYFVRVNPTSTWCRFLRSFMSGTARCWEPGPARNSSGW